jgi:hypothetical protein
MAEDLFKYRQGEEIRAGDLIAYAGEPGEVVFVVRTPTGDAVVDWYLVEHAQGGFMIDVARYGRIFLTEADEDLFFLSRRT